MTPRKRSEPAARTRARRTDSATATAVLAAFLAGLPGAPVALAAPVPAAPTPVAAAARQLVPADAAAVMKAVRAAGAAGAKAVILNVWATWCSPCREEFPDILKIGRDLKSRGAALVLVSGDFDDSRDEAVRFLADHGVDFTTYIKTGNDEAFIDGLAKEWSGMFPTTMVFDGAGRLRHLREGKVSYQQLRDLVLEVIDNPAHGPEKEKQQ